MMSELLLITTTLAGLNFMPGQPIALNWETGRNPMDMVSINAVYEHAGESVSETIARVQNTGAYTWNTPVHFTSPAVRLEVTETDLLVSGATDSTDTFSIGEHAQIPTEEDPTLARGLVLTEEGVYYYVTDVGTLRPFVTWETAGTYTGIEDAREVTRAELSGLTIGRPMLPALGTYVSFATLNGTWRVDMQDGAQHLTRVRDEDVSPNAKVFPLPDTMAWALR